MKLALLTTFATLLAAQDPRFEVHSRLVQLPVTVTDSEGRPVDGLGIADFIVLDNGIPRKATVDTIGTGVAPIALVVAVQGSGLSAAVIAKVRKIGGMIQPLLTGESGCAALVLFSTHVQWLQDCTTDAGALDHAFEKLRPGIDAKRARMLDAADEAVVKLSKKANMRRVLLIIAESRDRGSEAELATVTAAAQSQGVAVYFATYSQFKTAFTFDDRPLTTRRSATEPIPKVWETADNELYSYNNPRVIQQDQSVDLLTGVNELLRLHHANAAQILTGATGGTIFPFIRQKGLEEAIQKAWLRIARAVCHQLCSGGHDRGVSQARRPRLRSRRCSCPLPARVLVCGSGALERARTPPAKETRIAAVRQSQSRLC